MQQITIIHNPRCSKSRATLELIESRGIKPSIIDYLHGELTKEILTSALTALNMKPKDVLRQKDLEALNLRVNQDNDQELIDLILKHPGILERPIIIKGNKAVIGRPPENVLLLID